MARQNAAIRAVLAMAARRRVERNAELRPRGLALVDRRDLVAGDVVVAVATFEPLFVVATVQPARARNYVVVDGQTPDGKPYRTSGHVIDEVLIRLRNS